jgi:hypothetical protein
MSADICSGNVPRSFDLPYVQSETSRHGKAVYYFRIGDGPRVRLRAEEGYAAFKNAYEQAVTYYILLSPPDAKRRPRRRSRRRRIRQAE